MNPELWKEVNETLRDYENKTGVQIKCDWRLDPKVKKIVNEGPVTTAEIKQTIPVSPLGSEQPILMEDPSSLEIFEAIQGPVNKNHQWFVEDPEVNLEFLNEDFMRELELESRKPFFVGNFIDDDGKEQGQPNDEVVPFAFEFFKKDERFTNAEKLTNYDSGLLALCAICAETPEKQAILYKKYLNLILSIHESNPKLLKEWLDIQMADNVTHVVLPRNDHLENDFNQDLKPVEERLIIGLPLDDFEGTWQKRIEELGVALSEDQFEPYHLRWIEFLSHSTDIPQIHGLFVNAEVINKQYQEAVEAEKNAAEARKREEIETEEPIRPIRVVEPEKVSERIHKRVINRTPGGLRTLALVGLVGAVALWLAFCRPQPQSETILIPGTNITIDTTGYKYENPDKYLATFPGIMNENLSSVAGRCEGNWAVSNNLRPANFDRDNANTPYRQRVAQMSLSERNSHQILIQKCVEFIGHVNPRGSFEFNIQPIGLLAKHKDNGVTNSFKEPRDYRDFFSKVA